jgi:Spy/CpxP family protein refolding chaperone
MYMKRSKALALAFLLGALLVGGVLGFTADRVMAGERECVRLDRTAMRQRFAEELTLTPAQRAAVDSLLDKRHRDMTAAMDPIRTRLDSIRANTRSEIARLLDEEQRVRFERWMADHKKMEHKPPTGD